MRFTLVALSVVMTAAGLSRPEFAGRAAQLLVATATIAVVAAIVRRQWSNLAPRISRPFLPSDPHVTSGIETPDVTELVRSIESSNGRIPPLIANHVAQACRGRLADRHRLQLHLGADRDKIQAMVSPTMWTLLSAGPDEAIEVSIRNLPLLLDEVDVL